MAGIAPLGTEIVRDEGIVMSEHTYTRERRVFTFMGALLTLPPFFCKTL